MRDEIINFVMNWSSKLELPVNRILGWIAISPNRFYDWKRRYNKPNEHNHNLPKSHWLLQQEIEAITVYAKEHPYEGYRLLTYMMLDKNIVAVSASSVYRVLTQAGLLNERNTKTSKKGTGFIQPTRPHEHWHNDISYINIACTFYYLISILDGYSRYIVHWELRESMTENDIEIVIQRALEKFPGANPRIISDNGPQYISKDFKLYVRQMEMTHVKTSPYYPQSNGKLERYHRTIKTESVRRSNLSDINVAREILDDYVKFYNSERLHSAIGYIAPLNKLIGKEQAIFAERRQKLRCATDRRKQSIKNTE